MALETTDTSVSYEGSGANPYEIDFQFLDPSHLQVKVINSSEVETVLTSGQFTVTHLSDRRGSLVTSTSYDDTNTIVITRVTPLTQPIRMEDGNLLTADTLEAGLDRLTMIVQENKAVVEAGTAAAHASTHGAAASDPVTLAQSQITGLTTALDAKAAKLLTESTQTSTLYTLVLGDAGTRLKMDSVDPNSLVVPPHASVAIPVGSQILVQQWGTGQTTIAAGTGVTIHSRGNLMALAGQWACVALVKDAEDEWTLTGDRA